MISDSAHQRQQISPLTHPFGDHVAVPVRADPDASGSQVLASAGDIRRRLRRRCSIGGIAFGCGIPSADPRAPCGAAHARAP